MTPRDNPLTRTEILAEALRIVDEKGLSALSMRALASALGIEAMSLYHHFSNKGAILDGLAASVLLGMRAPTLLEGGWEQAAEESAVEFRRVLMAHPNVIPIMLSRSFNTGEATQFMEGPLTVLVKRGMDSRVAGEMYFAIVALAFGHASMSALSQDARPIEVGDSAISDAIDAVERPAEAAFRRAIRALIAGYEAP